MARLTNSDTGISNNLHAAVLVVLVKSKQTLVSTAGRSPRGRPEFGILPNFRRGEKYFNLFHNKLPGHYIQS